MDIFCKIINGEIPSKTIYEDDIVMVILDVSPKSNGHSLVIPKKHYPSLTVLILKSSPDIIKSGFFFVNFIACVFVCMIKLYYR